LKFYVTVESVLIADTPSTFMTRPVDKVDLVFGGIEGDLHFGLTAKAGVRQKMYPKGTEIMNRRQLSMVTVEELADVAQKMGIKQIKPEWIGANIVLSGYPQLTVLPIGTRMLLPSGGGIVCEGENEPCMTAGKPIADHYGMPELRQLFVKQAYKRRGVVGYVEKPGQLMAGDRVEIVLQVEP
jgi:MOSC domain-containing protein YiiM